MPTIRPSADLENNYNEISELCHEYSEPVFITKNGTGDLAVMSIEAYKLLAGKLELYSLINEGVEQAKDGKIKYINENNEKYLILEKSFGMFPNGKLSSERFMKEKKFEKELE